MTGEEKRSSAWDIYPWWSDAKASCVTENLVWQMQRSAAVLLLKLAGHSSIAPGCWRLSALLDRYSEFESSLQLSRSSVFGFLFALVLQAWHYDSRTTLIYHLLRFNVESLRPHGITSRSRSRFSYRLKRPSLWRDYHPSVNMSNSAICCPQKSLILTINFGITQPRQTLRKCPHSIHSYPRSWRLIDCRYRKYVGARDGIDRSECFSDHQNLYGSNSRWAPESL